MSCHLSTLAALPIALVSLAIGHQAQAACTAGNANGNVIESTPTSAFTDNGDGTVTHALTGLMWKQCAQGLSGAGCATGTRALMSWSGALKDAVADRTAGYADWRLPNKKELESIVEFCGHTPSINQAVFPATFASVFRSATTYRPFPAYAWSVNFYDGLDYPYDKSNGYDVRLVRGGRTFDSFDALDSIFANGFE